ADDAQRILRVGMTMEGVSHIRSAAVLPMRAGGAIIGLIGVFSSRESAIQSRDIKALSRIADFWGPMMADAWVPDGIPSAIAEKAAVDSTATESSAISEETAVAEAVSSDVSRDDEPVVEGQDDSVLPETATAVSETPESEAPSTPAANPIGSAAT